MSLAEGLAARILEPRPGVTRMRQGWAAGLWAVTVAACGPAEENVTIRGTVMYAEYSSGEILLKLVEEWTEDCNPFSCDLQTPGETVARERLAAPGAFSLSARVQRDPGLDLLAYALGQGQDEGGCRRGPGRRSTRPTTTTSS